MKFSHTHEDGNTIEYTIPQGATIGDVLDSFVDFMRGCSYNIPYDQYLCLVSDDVETITDHNYDPPEQPRESYHDYMGRRMREDMHDE